MIKRKLKVLPNSCDPETLYGAFHHDCSETGKVTRAPDLIFEQKDQFTVNPAVGFPSAWVTDWWIEAANTYRSCWRKPGL